MRTRNGHRAAIGTLSHSLSLSLSSRCASRPGSLSGNPLPTAAVLAGVSQVTYRDRREQRSSAKPVRAQVRERRELDRWRDAARPLSLGRRRPRPTVVARRPRRARTQIRARARTRTGARRQKSCRRRRPGRSRRHFSSSRAAAAFSLMTAAAVGWPARACVASPKNRTLFPRTRAPRAEIVRREADSRAGCRAA